MLLLSWLGHIIFFVLVIYLSLKFPHYQINPTVYKVNLVDFMGGKGEPQPTQKGQMQAGKEGRKGAAKIPGLPVQEEKKTKPKKHKETQKPKQVKKHQEPKKKDPSEKAPKGMEKPPITMAKKEEHTVSKEYKMGSDRGESAVTEIEEGELSGKAKTGDGANNRGASNNAISGSGGIGTGSGADGGSGIGGGTTSVEREEEELQRFQAMVRKRIEEAKTYPYQARERGFEGAVYLRFTILTNGGVDRIKAEQSSGWWVLDHAAIEAIKRAAPFLPFPESLKGKDIEMAITLVFKLEG